MDSPSAPRGNAASRRANARSNRKPMATTTPYEIVKEPVHISFAEQALMRDVYGFAAGMGRVALDGYLWTPRGKPSKTLVVYMHPAATMHNLPIPAAMVRAGAHVLLPGGRYNRNDGPL